MHLRTLALHRPAEVPYGDLDPAIVRLCRELNRLPRITTSSSCQGFIDGHRPNDPWHVHIQPAGAITPEGYAAIEFIAWFQTPAREAGFDISIELSAPPPYLNGPGESLRFILRGHNKHPDQLATFLREQVEEHFFIP